MRSDRPQPAADRSPPAARGRRLRVPALAAAFGAVGLAAFLLGRSAGDDAPPPGAERADVAPPGEAADPPELAVDVPLERIDRLASLGGAQACAIGGSGLACTADGGESWQGLGELPERVLAVIAGPAGTRLAAASDGVIYEVREGREPRAWAEPPHDLLVVDAVAQEGRLWLLAHRYDAPTDPMKLPRVIETVLLTLGESGTLERRGALRGYGGERLLVQSDGTVFTWALYDQRAWRSDDGGRTFRRLPWGERFGADVGGRRVLVERGAERLPGPGRPARASSTLLVSADGDAWETAFVTPGELVVDFADARLGCVVARGEGAAYLTRDGGRSFHVLVRDDRLDATVALAHVAGTFLAATEGGAVLRLRVP